MEDTWVGPSTVRISHKLSEKSCDEVGPLQMLVDVARHLIQRLPNPRLLI